jgi:predicted ribosome quality control (RQC) complex YloA/Tae2 family protein
MMNMQDAIKRELTNIDYLYLCSEIHQQVINTNGRLDQFYLYGENSDRFIFRFRTKEGKKDLVFNPPEFLFIRQSEQVEMQTQTSPFVSMLKSRFSNYILKGVEQLQNDRIIRLRFENGSILLEGMRNFNILILDENENIINSYKKDERITIGEKYSPPKSAKHEISKENILQAMKEDEKIVVAITRKVALPAFYVNEALGSEGIDPKTRTSEINDEMKKSIAERLEEFHMNLKNHLELSLEKAKQENEQGRETEKEEKKTERIVMPVLIEGRYMISDKRMIEKIKERKENKESEIAVLNSLSEIQEIVYHQQEMQEIEKEKGKRMNKLAERLRHQEEREKELIQEINQDQEKGNWIMQNANHVNEIIRKYNEIKIRGNKEELEKFLKENNLEMTKNGIKMKIEKK